MDTSFISDLQKSIHENSSLSDPRKKELIHTISQMDISDDQKVFNFIHTELSDVLEKEVGDLELRMTDFKNHFQAEKHKYHLQRNQLSENLKKDLHTLRQKNNSSQLKVVMQKYFETKKHLQEKYLTSLEE